MNYGPIASCIQFGGWASKRNEKTTAVLVTCSQLPAFPARSGVHPLTRCFSRLSQVSHCCSSIHSGAQFPSEPGIEALSTSSLPCAFGSLSSRPGPCSWRPWEELFRQLGGEAAVRAVRFLGSCSRSDDLVLCPHLSCSSCCIHACVWPWTCWAAPRATDFSSSRWTCLAIWTPGRHLQAQPAPSLGDGGTGPCPAGSMLPRWVLTCHPFGSNSSLCSGGRQHKYELGKGFVVVVKLFMSHLTVGNLIYLCPDNVLGKLLMNKLEGLDELFSTNVVCWQWISTEIPTGKMA